MMEIDMDTKLDQVPAVYYNFCFHDLVHNIYIYTCHVIVAVLYLLPANSSLLPLRLQSQYIIYSRCCILIFSLLRDDLHINKQTNIVIANHRHLLKQNN
jgi:hypothetical protein